MITTTFSFPRHATRQTELRTNRIGAGNPVTKILPKPPHAPRQAEWRSAFASAGSPVTEMLPKPPHAPRQAEWRSICIQAGKPVSTVLVFSYPLIRSDLPLSHAIAGSPVTASLAFARPFRQTSLQSAFEHAGNPVTESVAFYRLPVQHAALKWESGRKTYETASVRFRNDYNNYITSPLVYRYDWKTSYGTEFRYRHRSLVKGGWRIVAKNLETEESFELGFIDADQLAVGSQSASPSKQHVLEGIFLTDGDYEISVLTSSLFWNDARDGNIRTISVRQGEEISPLPVIYNLRSSVSFGTRTIQWSASHSEVDDCLFDIWYGNESPVDTNRSPDATVWYSNSMTEYQTSFAQNAPAWVAVAAIRPGNEAEKGKVHELFLDWSSVPPRAPDDVVVLPEALPVFDTNILKKPLEDVDLALVF